MSVINLNILRGISTSSFQHGKYNFDKFLLTNKRGTKLFKKKQVENRDPDIPIDKRGIKEIGFSKNKRFIKIREMVPELIVPNLTDFNLKPYVSYKSENVCQSKFTAKDLFNIVYRTKIMEDFNNGKLDAAGNSLKPSKEENLTPQKARLSASKPGSDIFTSPPLPLGTITASDPK